ncbi:PREDICTED: F-box/kelch-repeat protein At3g06240-like [Fragaria vesca subsp. vesca]|uniref:F-box/kelch-repeat protein At3g06240-like n=1 Tax=Fragaria vesca subsp. vesca TaxID=101020 RepID=UPI0002C2E9EA|nr:PREDICTED: F-box/kelch-repeat protein At3g06240-like [Fragaria vesca subsp. vesca]
MAANAFLPEEIILEIVARLPVKSVGRCRCVSTRWRSLFSDPHFAKSHFQLGPKHRALIIQHLIKLETLASDLSNTSLFEKESLVLRNLNSPFYHKHVQFLGSCNGLVAVRVFHVFHPYSEQETESFLIWNPSTGFFKNFPGRGHMDNHKGIKCGFGYVSKTDEYKLVMGDAILSSKTESWKLMEILPPGADVWMIDGVFFRDALYWLECSRHQEQDQARHMYAFDLEKEEFSIMQLPSALQTLDIRTWNHGVTREGCLYAMVLRKVYRDCVEFDYYVVELWVMRDYGNNDYCWTRSFGVKIPSTARRHWYLWVGSISVSETSASVMTNCPVGKPANYKLMPTSHYRNEEENSDIWMIENNEPDMVVYEESLYRLD